MRLLFDKKKPTRKITVDGKEIELQPKPSTGIDFGSIFKPKKKEPTPQKPATAPTPAPKPMPQMQPKPAPAPTQQAPRPITPMPPPQPMQQRPTMPTPQPAQQKPTQPKQPSPSIITNAERMFTRQKSPPVQQVASQQQVQKPPVKERQRKGFLYNYAHRIAGRNRKIEESLRQNNMNDNVYDFIVRMVVASFIVTAVVGIIALLVLLRTSLSPIASVVLAVAIAFATNQFVFNAFLQYPIRKTANASKNIERDILFAARDMIISLRSGMPLYNAIALVSTGYADASKEFAKITRRTELGLSLEDAIDQSISETKSASFRRIMLQASTSIKAGADIVASLQSITDQLSQERLIALRRYGQRLNAIAMFYMLFGVILPSMGIAVATILTTFISLFTVNISVLEVVAVALVFMQILFLQLIRTSRPTFAL